MEQVLTARIAFSRVNGLPTSSSWAWGNPLPTWTPCQAIRLTQQTVGLGWSAGRITSLDCRSGGALKDIAPLGVNLAISLNATAD
jgi:23S rRNA (adenine2503-C2)-methyltransferase